MSFDAETLVHECLRRHARGRVETLPSDTRLADVVDSLRLILVVLDLQRALGRRPFEPAAAARLSTVGDLVAALRTGASP